MAVYVFSDTGEMADYSSRFEEAPRGRHIVQWAGSHDLILMKAFWFGSVGQFIYRRDHHERPELRHNPVGTGLIQATALQEGFCRKATMNLSVRGVCILVTGKHIIKEALDKKPGDIAYRK